MKNFKMGDIVKLKNLDEQYVYIGYNKRTDRHEIAIVGKKTDAKISEITLI